MEWPRKSGEGGSSRSDRNVLPVDHLVSNGHYIARDALSLFPKLRVESNGAHAFYLGAELAKAEVAFALGKRYAQDEPLDWGCGSEKQEEDKNRLREAGHTLRKNA